MTYQLPKITIEKTYIDIWKDIDVSATFDVVARQTFTLTEVVNIDKNIDIDADVDITTDINGNHALFDVKVEEHSDLFNWTAGGITTTGSSISQLQGGYTIPVPGPIPDIELTKFTAVAQATGDNTFTELMAVVEVFDTGGSFVNVVGQSITD